MKLSRRDFHRSGIALAAAVLAFRSNAFAETALDDGVVLARATDVTLDASETHVVLMPVPPPRRPPKAKPKIKGAKPAPPQMHLVLRDVVSSKGFPTYDVFLVLEGPNIFQATTTRIQVGSLERKSDEDADGAKKDGEKKDDVVKRETIAFAANDAFAKLTKTRGYHMRHLRVAIVRRAVKDAHGTEIVPPDPAPPQIGAIELVRV